MSCMVFFCICYWMSHHCTASIISNWMMLILVIFSQTQAVYPIVSFEVGVDGSSLITFSILIFATLSPDYVSSQAGVIYSKISDNHPCFLCISPGNILSVGMNKNKYMSNRGLIARRLIIISNNRCLKMNYQLPRILTPIAIQTSTTIFYDHLTQMKNKYMCHIDM